MSDRPSRLLLVAGEPGAGKTRLAAEVARDAYHRGATVLFGRCDEGLAVPFQPFVEALRHYAKGSAEPAFGPLAAELTRLVPELDVPGRPLKADPETEQYRLFEAVREWLQAASTPAPLLLVLDDLHWATRPTLLLMRHVVRNADVGRLLVVGTYRDTEPGELGDLLPDFIRESATTLVLGGLEADAIADLIDADDTARARDIYEITAGNAFFVTEIVRNARSDATTQIPGSVREVVRGRLARLPDQARNALAVAAVTGEEFELRVVQKAMDEDITSAIEAAMDGNLITELGGLRYRFVHAIVRSTIDEALSAPKRAQLHLAVAEALESLAAPATDDLVPELARHFAAAAGIVGPERAIAHQLRAAELALERSAAQDAVGLYEAVLASLGSGDDRRVDILTALGEAQRRAGDRRHEATLAEAVDIALSRADGARLAAALLAGRRGFLLMSGRASQHRIASIERAIDLSSTDATRARLLSMLATELSLSEHHDRRLQVSRQAVASARLVGDDVLLADVLATHVVSIGEPATLLERRQSCAELEAIAERIDDPSVLFRIAFASFFPAMEAGDLDAIDRSLSVQLDLVGQLGQPLFDFNVLVHRSMRASLAGRVEEAERLADEFLGLGEALGLEDARFAYLACVTGARLDRLSRAEFLPEQVETYERFPLPSVLAALAFTYAIRGDLAEARELYERVADEAPQAPPDPAWMLAMHYLCLDCLELEDTDRAPVFYEALIPFAEQVVACAPQIVAPVAELLGRLAAMMGRIDEAETHLTAALGLSERMQAPAWAARCRVWVAELLLKRGERVAEAEGLLQQANATARENGFDAITQQVQKVLGRRAPA